MAKKRPAKPTIVGSPFGTPNGNKTNKDDNDDDKDPIKPSPFKKNKVSSLQKGPPTMKIIHVVPKVSLPIDDPDVSTGEEGFTIIIEGFMQNKQVQCLHKKNSCDRAAEFCAATEPLNHVFLFQDEDNEVMQEGNDGCWIVCW